MSTNPTDRAKGGVKRHLLTEVHGFPVGLSVTRAYVHDVRKVEEALVTMPFLPPLSDDEYEQHFCADKGYDSREVRSLITLCGYHDHIKAAGRRSRNLKHMVTEHVNGYMNAFIHG